MNTCAMCFEGTRRNRVNTTCGHKFHNKCLAQWTRRANTCPMCRATGMRNVVQRDMANALNRLRFAIEAFVEVSGGVDLKNINGVVPTDFWKGVDRKTARVVKTVLVSAYFDKEKRYQSLYLDVVKHAAAVDRKIFRTGLSPNAVYRAFYTTFEAPDMARAVLESVDLFSVHYSLLLRPLNNTTNLVPDFAFLKKLVKALRVEDTDGVVKALTKARKRWRQVKLQRAY